MQLVEIRNYYHTHEQKIVGSSLKPIYGIKHLLGFQLSQQEGDLSTPFPQYSLFPKIKTDLLNRVRYAIDVKTHLDKTDLWCEKLLRYTMINYGSLIPKLEGLGWNSSKRIEIVNVINSLFIENYFTYKDLRFLNASLRLTDFNWLAPDKSNVALYFMYYRNIKLVESGLKDII